MILCKNYILQGSSVWPELKPILTEKRHFGNLPTKSFLDNYF